MKNHALDYSYCSKELGVDRIYAMRFSGFLRKLHAIKILFLLLVPLPQFLQ